MKAITEFNKKTGKTIADAAVEKLKELEELLGVEFTFDGGSIGSGDLTLKIVARLKADKIAGLSATEMKYAENLRFYDQFDGEFCKVYSKDIGKEFKLGSNNYVLIGLTSLTNRASVVMRSVATGKHHKTNEFRLVSEALAK